jgi:Na+-transporting NADH:ubiquinone oxidoreductase subunit F
MVTELQLFQIFAGVVAFSGIVLLLVAIILLAKSTLVPSGEVRLRINEDPKKDLLVPVGGKLLGALSDKEIYLPSACGGGGTCAQCKVVIKEGGGEILPTERGLVTRREMREGVRLGCQVPVKQDMDLEIPPEIFDVRKWECTVRSNRNVATFIKELILELPEGEDVNFKAGGYIQIECPPFELSFKDFDIEKEYHEDWDRFNVWDYEAKFSEGVTRAYSMANYPSEKGIIMLNVRIATPPPSAPKAPPGVMSSYIFNLKPGDHVTISGPYGEFFIQDTPAEKIYIGGGAGMAPLRSHIFELLKNRKAKEKISYWYGARSLRETFYAEEFEELAEEFPNFQWNLALSEPMPEDNWQGPTGFIHKVVYENYLKDHPAPEDCEYYMCGPPMMISAVMDMLDNLGVERDNIYFDDFGI